MFHMMGALAIVPAVMLVTLSYFVLFTREKTGDNIIKTFGLVIAILLWVAAAAVLGVGIANMGCGHQGHWGRAGFGKCPCSRVPAGADARACLWGIREKKRCCKTAICRMEHRKNQPKPMKRRKNK